MPYHILVASLYSDDSRFECLTVSLSLSHWYPGSGVVLDCIDSRSLHPYFLSIGPVVLEERVFENVDGRTLIHDLGLVELKEKK